MMLKDKQAAIAAIEKLHMLKDEFVELSATIDELDTNYAEAEAEWYAENVPDGETELAKLVKALDSKRVKGNKRKMQIMSEMLMLHKQVAEFKNQNPEEP